jgi:uncharacterized protein (AIM24 family)
MPAMHEVDYEIIGDDMQFVRIELDPGEAVVSEAGSILGGLGDLLSGDRGN